MGWLIALGVMVLLAVLPLGASVIYDQNGPLVRILAGLLKIKVFPGKSKDPDKPMKEKKPKKKKKLSEEAEAVDSAAQKTPATKGGNASKPQKDRVPKGGSVTDFIPFVQLGLNFLGDFRRKLRVNRLELNVILAGGDPADLAINYGKTWVALGNLWPRLETWFVIKKRQVEVQCDFEGSATTVYVRLDLTITLGRILFLVFVYAFRGLKEFLRFRKKRNGGNQS